MCEPDFKVQDRIEYVALPNRHFLVDSAMNKVFLLLLFSKNKTKNLYASFGGGGVIQLSLTADDNYTHLQSQAFKYSTTRSLYMLLLDFP